MTRGSAHSTTQPCRSLRRVLSTARNSLGMRLQVTGVRSWMASRGGHCGSGFFRSLLNMAAEMGMMFCGDMAAAGGA